MKNDGHSCGNCKKGFVLFVKNGGYLCGIIIRFFFLQFVKNVVGYWLNSDKVNLQIVKNADIDVEWQQEFYKL